MHTADRTEDLVLDIIGRILDRLEQAQEQITNLRLRIGDLEGQLAGALDTNQDLERSLELLRMQRASKKART